MSENNLVILFMSIYVFISLIGISSTEYVPVYMWETTQFSEIVPALKRVSQESFKSVLQERAAKHTPVLLFAEQNLSPEDLAQKDVDGNCLFSHLSSLKDTTQISYWPSVKGPIKVIKELRDRTVVETSIKAIIDDANFILHDNDILVVDLDDASEGENRVQMLKRHDKDISTVYNRFAKEHENIITVLTGHHPSWITSEELRSHRRVREAGNVVAKDEMENQAGFIIYENEDVLFYVNSAPILSSNGHQVSLENFSISTESKSNTGMNIIFESTTITDITVKLNFDFAGGYWLLNEIVVHNDSMKKDEDKEYSLRVKDVYAPLGFSYHCILSTFFSLANPNQNITFPGLQMQPYLNATTNHTFGDAYDCIGFMSAPIWSGIFVTFILALIMTFGLTMMMNIKTMDRFDDPKGKTITISAAE